MTDVQVLLMFLFLDSKMAKQQLQKWELKFVTELEPLEGASPVPSGRQCQINQVDGLESSLYLTKVDALQIYPFKACYLVMLVPPDFDFRPC